MANALPSQIFEQFKGIREYNGVNYGGQISAISCKNVELFKTDIGGGTGIRTVSGDKVFVNLPSGYKAIKNFSATLNGISFFFIYGENAERGALFYVSGRETVELTLDGLTFEINNKCNGLTMAYGENDLFVFTNGKQAVSVVRSGNSFELRKIEAVDNKGRPLEWLSMTEWNGFLVVASKYGVHSSAKNNIYQWNDTITEENRLIASWYIEFGKRVTAVKSFSTGLFMFTDSDCSYINTTPNDIENAVRQNVAMNGCFSFESLTAHDTYLFFYDDNQKGVFYIQMTDTGQTRPVGSVTKEVQSFFTGTINTCKMYSCIYDEYNEIWLLVNDKVLVYDYIHQEFIERDMHPITSVCKHDNNIYVCNDLYEDVEQADGTIKTVLKNGRVLIEKMSETFDGTYIPAEYTTSIINMGSNSNLKKQKTPILLVLNENAINNFYVEITANFKTKNPKHIKLKVGNEGVWADETEGVEITDNMLWDNMRWTDESAYKKRVVEISTPQTWYTMSIRFFTKEQGDGFSIVSMEMKRLKEKTKTKGR